MTRQQANNLSDNLVGIMTEIEDELLRKIAAQIARDNDISDTSKWRIRQLARMGQLDREALRLIKSYSGMQSEVLYNTLMNAALTEIGYVDAGMREAAAKGLISGDMTIPADRTAVNALTAYQKQAQNDLNMVNTVMRYQATAAYTGAVNNIYYQVHNALDTGTATVVTGSESLQSAIRNTIRELSWKGIPAFVDKAGRHWSPEAYVRMDLRTTVGNTARAAQWSRCDNFGVSLIAVDSHPGARPKCAPYQGRIFSRDGSSGTTTDGSGRKITYSPLSSTSYGEPDGLFGINCGHSCYPFIPGVNLQRYFPYDPEENAARYKEFQTQRALEREIRASKRECMMLQAAGDKEGYEKAALRLRTQREKYRVYSNEHGLSLHNDRTQVYGFDRSQSMKAVWAERKAKKVKSAPSSGGSGGHAVTVQSPGGSNGGTGAVYSSTPIPQPGTVMYNINPTIISQNLSQALTNNNGSGIIKSSNNAPAKSLSLSNLNEFDEWQKKYYSYNSGVSFARNDNQNIYTYTGGAYDAINALERGGEQLNIAMKNYGDLSKYEGIGEKISEELSKFKLHEPIIVRRAVGNVDYITGATSSIEDMKKSIGKIYTEKGFTSTTICSDTMLPFGGSKSTKTVLDIYVPTNSRGAYIYKISEHPAEFEYLLDRNTKFKVIDAGEREVVDKYTGKTTIERFMKLEVIPDD